MRKAGSKYLPQEPREPDKDYRLRLNRSVFFDAYRKTVEALSGMVFKKEIIIGDDVPPEIQTQLEDVDLCGNHIDVFAKRHFTDQFEGYAFILVEMEAPLPQGSTLADEQVLNRRPYWVSCKGDEIINWRIERVNGRQEFTQLTRQEITTEPDGLYGEREVTRFRTFRKVDGVVEWELNRLDSSKPEDQQIIPEGGGQLTIKRIPVAIAGKLGALPPLLGQAHLNVSHYQNASDQENILHITRVPVLVRVGVKQDSTEQVVSVSGTMDLPEGGNAFWLEIKEAGATSAGRTHLLDIEQRMGMLGLSTLTQRQDTQITATEKRQDTTEKLSELATMARSEKDCIELAIDFHNEYLTGEVGKGGSIELGIAEEALVLTPQHFQVLLTALMSGKLSLETFLAAVLNLLETAGVLAEDVTVDDEVKRINEMTRVSQAVGLAANANPTGLPGQLGSMFNASGVQ
jgi:hypothetical protein